MSSSVKLEISAVAYGGEALGRLDSGEVCFVRGALPGERAEVIITERKKRFVRGKITALENHAAGRIVPACPYASECPGCSFQHSTYEVELEWKQKQFERFLQKFPGTRRPFFPSPERFGWRNRLKVTCENGRAGYRGFDNVTLIPIEKCLLVKDEINTVLKNTPLPREGTLFFRSSASWCGEIGNAPEEYLTEILPEAGEFRIPAAGFFQTNPAVAAELCSRVTEAIGRYGAKKMLELFCGAGIFSIAAARKFPDLRCRGIELDPRSIKAAKINAKLNQTADRCSFMAGDAAAFTAEDYDVVLLDPPRSGLEKKLVGKLLDRAYPLLLYVSCGPDTLCRDLEMLSEKYNVAESGALDMFPCTAHFETFTILTSK